MVSKATLDLSHLVNSREAQPSTYLYSRTSEQVCKSSEGATGQECTSRHVCVRDRERAQVGVFIVLPSEHKKMNMGRAAGKA